MGRRGRTVADRSGREGDGYATPDTVDRSHGALALIDRRPWLAALLLLLALASILAVTGFLAVHLGPREPFSGTWEGLVYSGPLAELVSYWQRWDALWYQHIAENGYAAGNGTTAFYPLYPLLARITSTLFPGNTVLGLLVVSAAAFVGATTLLWRLVRMEAKGGLPRPWALPFRVTERTQLMLAALTVLLIVLFPASFFLLAPYTESLFLLLAVASLLLVRTGRPWLAGAVGLLAGLTRTQGVFLALPIAYEHLRERRSWDWIRGRGGRPPRLALLAALLPLGGIVLFTLYQAVMLGEQRSGLDTLAIWGYKLALPWDALGASWTYITGGVRNLNAKAVEVFNLVCLLGAAVIAVIGARRLPGAYTLYALPSLGLLFFRSMYFSPLMSVGRYVLVVFPCFMVAASWLTPHPRMAAAILVVSALLELALFQYWARWGFVG